MISPLLSQSTTVAPASSTEPTYSQPEGGRRLPSQTGRHHHETLGQTQPHPAEFIQVGGCQARSARNERQRVEQSSTTQGRDESCAASKIGMITYARKASVV